MRNRRGVSYETKSKNSQASGKGSRDLHFLLLSSSHFGVAVPYALMTPQLKELLRNYGAAWSPEAKAWECRLERYKSCLQEVREYFEKREEKEGGNVYKIPEFVFRAEEEMPLELEVKNHQYSVVRSIRYNAAESGIDPTALPFFGKLYDFQKSSLQFSIRRHGRLLLADEMGVGKTIQSLAMVSVYRHEWPFLIICPSTLRLNWQQEALHWLADYLDASDILVYCKGGQAIRQGIKAMIISYDLAWKIRDTLDMFAVVIADEAHYLKNSGNKRTDALMPFLSSRKRVVLLTGTPALAKPREIYNLISIVRPDVFVNFKEFGYRYCEPTVNPWSRGLEFNGCQNSKELYFLLKDKVMIRRLKKEVLTQLPDKQRQKVLVETDKNVVKEIRELLRGMGGEGGEQSVIEMLGNFSAQENMGTGEDRRAAVMKAYGQTGLAKLESTKEYVLSLLQNDIKLIVFAHHIAVLDGLEQAIKKDYKYMRIDGKVSKEQRHERVGLFQDDPAVRVALLSISAAGVGLTLTAASTVVFAELHWTPGMMVQAEDRAHRIGQKNSVNCHYLIGEGTLDDLLYRYLDKKINNVSSFVDGKGDKLEMEYLEKGQKGKVSVSAQERSDQTILFKFESIKPVIDKYFATRSQETEISESESREDIDSEVVGVNKRRRRGQPLSVPEEQSATKQFNSDNDQDPQQPNPETHPTLDNPTHDNPTHDNPPLSVLQPCPSSGSTFNFILSNAQQLPSSSSSSSCSTV